MMNHRSGICIIYIRLLYGKCAVLCVLSRNIERKYQFSGFSAQKLTQSSNKK